jgi:imidazolonepropionase-like amidohydrolase
MSLAHHIRESITARQNDQPVWLRVNKLLDARQKRIIENAHLVYDKSKILHIGITPPSEEILRGAAMVDLSDVAAIPPLFDAHTHISLCGSELDADRRAFAQKRTPEEILAEAEIRARALLARGVIGMRDGGDKDGTGLNLSEKSRTSAETCGLPRILSPGPGIHRKGRYGSFFCQPLEDHLSIPDCVAHRVQAGADHIKIVPTGIINFAKGAVTAAPQFSAEEVREHVTASAAHARMVMAHASGTEGIRNAIDGGANTIEHGYFVTRDQLSTMRDRNIAWVPTFAPVHMQIVHAGIMGWDATVLDHLRRILDAHAESLRHALQIGVRILVGSDAGSYAVPHASGLVEEMLLMEAAGMPALDVLCEVAFGNASTLAPALPLRLLEPGYPATFLLVSAASLHTLRFFQNPLVIFGGRPLIAENASNNLF